jgi:hypothetical protein
VLLHVVALGHDLVAEDVGGEGGLGQVAQFDAQALHQRVLHPGQRQRVDVVLHQDAGRLARGAHRHQLQVLLAQAELAHRRLGKRDALIPQRGHADLLALEVRERLDGRVAWDRERVLRLAPQDVHAGQA